MQSSLDLTPQAPIHFYSKRVVGDDGNGLTQSQHM